MPSAALRPASTQTRSLRPEGQEPVKRSGRHELQVDGTSTQSREPARTQRGRQKAGRPTIRHRPLPSRAPRRVFAEGDCYRSLGFLYPRTHSRATSPAHFPDVLPPQAARFRRRRLLSYGHHPGPVAASRPRAFPRCFAAAAGAFSPKAIITVAWGFSTPGPVAASRPRAFPRCFAAAASAFSPKAIVIVWSPSRSRGRVPSPAHFPDVLPPPPARFRRRRLLT